MGLGDKSRLGAEFSRQNAQKICACLIAQSQVGFGQTPRSLPGRNLTAQRRRTVLELLPKVNSLPIVQPRSLGMLVEQLANLVDPS